MSTSITLTSAVRANLLALQNTAANQSTTQQRLATGKKVNSALDNPTNYFTAAALSSRAGQLTNLLNSMTNGVNTLKAADNGLTSITTTIQSMQATVTQARQDASWQSASYALDSATIGTSSLKTIGFSGGAVGATVVTVNLNDQETITGATTGFGGTTGTTGAGTSGTLTIQAADINGGSAVTVSVNTADVVSTVAANINTAVGYSLATVVGGELKLQDAGPNTITVGGSGGETAAVGLTTTTSSATAGNTSTVDAIVSAINGNASLAGKVKASNDAGQLQISNLSTLALTVTGVGASGKVDGGAGTTTDRRQYHAWKPGHAVQSAEGPARQDCGGRELQRHQPAQRRPLKLFFNEISTSSITIQSTNTNGVNSATLGITPATNTEFQNNTQLDTRLADAADGADAGGAARPRHSARTCRSCRTARPSPTT